MKRIQIRKPDIKGFFVKVRNLKKEDIKRHFEQKRERRKKILEERQNSAFSRKMRPVYKWMNRLSLPLHFLLAAGGTATAHTGAAGMADKAYAKS